MNLNIFGDDVKALKNDGMLAACAATLNGIGEIDNKMSGILKQVLDVFGYNFAKQYDKVYNNNSAFISNYTVEERLVKL